LGAGAITTASTLDIQSSARIGRRLVTLNHRDLLVEAMLAQVLTKRWTWVGLTWGAHDFQPDTRAAAGGQAVGSSAKPERAGPAR
jgi:hypothetical protein